jgi:hypothetical protein
MATSFEMVVVKKLTDDSFHVRSIKHILQVTGSPEPELGGVYQVQFPRSEIFNCALLKRGSIADCAIFEKTLAPIYTSTSAKRTIESVQGEDTAVSANKKPNSPALARKSINQNTSSLNKSVLAAVATRSNGVKLKATEIQGLINPSQASASASRSAEQIGKSPTVCIKVFKFNLSFK